MTPPPSAATIERLLATLDVQLHTFSICEVGAGVRMIVDPQALVVAHFVLSGAGLLEVADGKPKPFSPGSILIVPAEQPQRIVADGPFVREVHAEDHRTVLADGLVRYDAAEGREGDVRMICATLSATYAGALGLFDGLGEPLVEDLAGVATIRAALEAMLAEHQGPELGAQLVAESFMKLVLVLLVRSQLARNDPPLALLKAPADQRLTSAVSTVLATPGANFTLAGLARESGMSRSTFAKAFMEAFGQTPMMFVQKARLNHARKLLVATDIPVKVVAANLGFASRSHFSRAFKALHGIDPSGFRQRGADPEG